MLDRLLALCPPRARLLEAACGTGKYWPLLLREGCFLVGIDQSAAMLRPDRGADSASAGTRPAIGSGWHPDRLARWTTTSCGPRSRRSTHARSAALGPAAGSPWPRVSCSAGPRPRRTPSTSAVGSTVFPRGRTARRAKTRGVIPAPPGESRSLLLSDGPVERPRAGRVCVLTVTGTEGAGSADRSARMAHRGADGVAGALTG
jgi:hypothetical protein